MNRVAGLAISHVRWVFLVSLILAGAGVAVAGGLPGVLSQSFALPGQPGYEANQKIVAQYGGGGATAPTVLAVRVPPDVSITDPAITADLGRGVQALSTALEPVPATGAARSNPIRIVAYRGPSDRALISADGRTTYVLIFGFSVTGQEPALDQTAADRFLDRSGLPAATQVFTTGLNVLSETTYAGGDTSTLVETLIGAAGALLVLAFVFGSFIAVLPLLVAAVSILTTYLLVRGLTLVTDVSAVVQYLVALIGLGVAIDYSLLLVTRWREERAAGRSNRDAVLESVRTAGHSVVFSGVTVAVGLLALVALPVPFLRSVGYGAVLIPLVSTAVSLTLLPALLAVAGPFLDRPRRRRARPASVPSPAWTWWARTVIRYRWAAAAAGLAVLVLLIVPAAALRVGPPETAALASSGPATSGLELLESSGIGSGALTPIEVLTTPADTVQVRQNITAVAGVRGVVETGRAGPTVVLDVIPAAEAGTAEGRATLAGVQDAVRPWSADVGGVGANSAAFNDAVYGSFPGVLAVIVLITLVLLTRAFRSLVLAIKAVILNLLSVGATYGFLTLVWQQGHGSALIWGIPATGAITNFIPLMVFAFLFGLSMDYEVFILARMRESFDHHRATSRAIADGLGHTGKLVTSAALILFLSFLSLSQTPLVDIKIFATGLGGGVLLDATVVRALLVPALVSLFGRWNWWLPVPLARLLRVEPSTAAYIRSTLDTPSAVSPQERRGEAAPTGR